jgi:hypothetical protein
MDFPDQSQGQGQLIETLQAVLHGIDVVDDVTDVAVQASRRRFEFDLEQVLERALRALYLRTEDSLASNVHGDEEARVGYHLDDPVQPPEREIRSGEESRHLLVQCQGRLRRTRSRYEGPVSGRLRDESACPLIVSSHHPTQELLTFSAVSLNKDTDRAR